MTTTPAERVALAADRMLNSDAADRDRTLAGLLNYLAATWDRQTAPLREHALAVATAATGPAHAAEDSGYPALFSTPGLKDFAEAVDAERSRQLTKFGDQHHPDGTGGSGCLYVADRYRAVVDHALKAGTATWRDILLEEVYEALAEDDPARLRAELVQVAAVCAAWISDLDRRDTEGA